MTDAHIRELLPDMLGRTRGGTWQEMDSARGKKLQGFNLLHAKFIDREVVVHLPDTWDDLDRGSGPKKAIFLLCPQTKSEYANPLLHV
jgi:hypothetical protein